MTGRVTKITPSFYGFITTEDGSQYFFHGSSYREDWDDLKKISPPDSPIGPEVLFDGIETEKGLRAENVRLR